MTVLDVVGLYYDAWANKKGDLSRVPLAPGFRFRGPVADFDDAEGYRACSIIDWEMDLPVARPGAGSARRQAAAKNVAPIHRRLAEAAVSSLLRAAPSGPGPR
jgi:hypothetical protein